MEIKLKIKNNGIQTGTIGWLAKNAATLSVGESKNGYRGVWLQDHEGKTITTLAIAGYHGEGDTSISTIERDNPYMLGLDFPCTDACWEALEVMIEKSVEILEQDAPSKKVFFEN